MGYTERLPTEIKAFPRPSGDGASLIAIHYVFFLQKKIRSWGSKVSSWKGHHRGPKARAGGQGKAMA